MIVDAMDYETTGVDPKTCEPVQVAVLTVDIHRDGSYQELGGGSLYLKINAPQVPRGAYDVHGIGSDLLRKEGVAPIPVISGIGPKVLGYNNRCYDDIISRRYKAHIEQSIDLYVATRRLKGLGKISKANLSTAYRELTGLEPENAHDALADVKMTLALIQPVMALKGFDDFAQLVSWVGAAEANVHMQMPFGKHKGKRLKDLPKSYVRWALENMTLTGDLKAGLEAL